MKNNWFKIATKQYLEGLYMYDFSFFFLFISIKLVKKFYKSLI